MKLYDIDHFSYLGSGTLTLKHKIYWFVSVSRMELPVDYQQRGTALPCSSE